jgi:hypothetical protein
MKKSRPLSKRREVGDDFQGYFYIMGWHQDGACLGGTKHRKCQSVSSKMKKLGPQPPQFFDVKKYPGRQRLVFVILTCLPFLYSLPPDTII